MRLSVTADDSMTPVIAAAADGESAVHPGGGWM
jgi:hypothetical protein